MFTIAFDITIKDYLKEIDEAPLLSIKEEQHLGKLIVEKNDPKAREQLIRSNLRLVVNLAKRYASRSMSLGDLIEEGNLGLIKAVDYYDPYRGTRFSTYAAWWIKQTIKRALLGNIQPVHIPTYMVGLINQWKHTQADLEVQLGKSPSLEEIADAMQLSVKKATVIYKIVNILGCVKDTFENDDLDEDQMLETTLQDRNAPLPEASLVEYEEKAKMIRMLDQISPREADVLRLHYGLDGKNPMTLRQIGEKLSLTRERVRQIQHEALAKLYDYMEA